MNRYLWMLLAATLVAGCRVVDSGERGFHPPETESGEERFAESRKLGEGILTAFRTRDFKMLRENMPGGMGDQMSEKDFLTSCRNFNEKFGELKEFRFLTALDTPAFDNLIWIVTFVRRGSGNTELSRQLLFRLVTMPVDGKTQVASCGFL